jgi:hypothetical protein
MSTFFPLSTRRLFLASLVFFAVSLVFSVANVVTVFSAPLRAVSVPTKVGYEGYLTDAFGAPLSGSHTLVFNLYSAATGGTSLWNETHTGVSVTSGLYSVLLDALPVSGFSGDRWLGVTVDGGVEITPRTRIASVPFALNADTAEHVGWSGITGMPSEIADGDQVGTGAGVSNGAAGRLPVFDSATTLAGASNLVFANNTLTVTNDVVYTGALRSYKNATAYAAYAYVPLTTPLTSTSWDGDAFSDQGVTTLNLMTTFGLPANVKAVVVRQFARDSAAWGTAGMFFALGPSSSSWSACLVRPAGGDVWAESTGAICPTNGNGTVYYRIEASGASTMDIWIEIWGYFL